MYMYHLRSLTTFTRNLDTNTLDRSEFMELCARHKVLLQPAQRWQQCLINTCGGDTFWLKQKQNRDAVEKDCSIEHSHQEGGNEGYWQILQILISSNFIILSSFCYTVIKTRTFYAIRFCFSMLAFLFIILQTSDVNASEQVHEGVTVMEIIIDSYFILEGLMKIIAIRASFQISDSLGLSRRSVLSSTLGSSGVLSAVASIISFSPGPSASGDWAKLCRLGFLTSVALRRMENIDVLMVRSYCVSVTLSLFVMCVCVCLSVCVCVSE